MRKSIFDTTSKYLQIVKKGEVSLRGFPMVTLDIDTGVDYPALVFISHYADNENVLYEWNAEYGLAYPENYRFLWKMKNYKTINVTCYPYSSNFTVNVQYSIYNKLYGEA